MRIGELVEAVEESGVVRGVPLIRRAVEAVCRCSLARWLLRRPDVAAGEAGFAYHGQLLAPMIAMTVVSAVEVVAVDLLLPWPWLRSVLLVIGVLGTVLVLGMLAGVLVHPHAVGPDGLRVRYGAALDVRVPWDAVAGISRAQRSRDGRTVQLDGASLHVVVAGQTTIEVVLRRPLAVTLPRGRGAEITSLRFHADDAAALVAAVRARMEPSPTGR